MNFEKMGFTDLFPLQTDEKYDEGYSNITSTGVERKGRYMRLCRRESGSDEYGNSWSKKICGNWVRLGVRRKGFWGTPIGMLISR